MIGRAFLLGLGLLLPLGARAQSPVDIWVDPKAPTYPIPPDFLGLSFETNALEFNTRNVDGYCFDAANAQLATLCRNTGIKVLRIGGSSVDSRDQKFTPGKREIDGLFAFARRAGTKVIYSLRLLHGVPDRVARESAYVWQHHRADLICLAIGNEPNLYKGTDPEITDEASFQAKWSRIEAAIVRAAPDAVLGGPDTGTHGTEMAIAFARRQRASGRLKYVLAHYYAGGFPKTKDPALLVDGMLSASWVARKYPAYHAALGAPARALGLPYRITELNNYVASYPGVPGGNNGFATALFALDALHWWAAHGCAGVNFHTVIGKYNGTVYRDAQGAYQVYPIAYGMKAFDVGSRGRGEAVRIGNPAGLNLTAYAVVSDEARYVTIINKEHGAGARDARITLHHAGAPSGAMYLTSAGHSGTDLDGVRFAQTTIDNAAPWRGEWEPLGTATPGQGVVVIPACSAAVIKMSLHPESSP